MVRSQLVARKTSSTLTSNSLSLSGSPRPEVSLLALRWGRRDVPVSNAEQLLPTNPEYLWSLLDLGIRPAAARAAAEREGVTFLNNNT